MPQSPLYHIYTIGQNLQMILVFKKCSILSWYNWGDNAWTLMFFIPLSLIDITMHITMILLWFYSASGPFERSLWMIDMIEFIMENKGRLFRSISDVLWWEHIYTYEMLMIKLSQFLTCISQLQPVTHIERHIHINGTLLHIFRHTSLPPQCEIHQSINYTGLPFWLILSRRWMFTLLTHLPQPSTTYYYDDDWDFIILMLRLVSSLKEIYLNFDDIFGLDKNNVLCEEEVKKLEFWAITCGDDIWG